MENSLEEQPIVGSEVAVHAVEHLLTLAAEGNEHLVYTAAITDAVYIIQAAGHTAYQEETLRRIIESYRQL